MEYPPNKVKFTGFALSHLVVSNFLVTSSTIAHRAPLSVGFSKQGHWGGLLFPSPGDLPDPESETGSPVAPALAGKIFTNEPHGKP